MKFKFKSKRKYRRHSGLKVKLKKQTVYTVAAIWLWLFAGIISVSFFLDGDMLSPLREALIAHVGWIMFPLPIFLLSLSTLFFKSKSSLAQQNVPMGSAIMLIGLTGLTHAGDIGQAFWNTVVAAVSPEGGILFFLGVVLIGMIVLLNRSLDSVVSFVLDGVQRILDWIGHLLSKTATKRKELLFGQEKLPLKIRDNASVSKPMIKPSVPLSLTSGKLPASVSHGMKSPSDLHINQSYSGEEMKLWEYPSLSLLSDGPGEKADRGNVNNNVDIIEKTLSSFGIQAQVVEVNPGPAVTQYCLKIALGTKVSKISSLTNDLALALAAPTGQVRIEAPIPGKDMVGIELPNRGLEFVTLKKMLESDSMQKAKSKLTISLGLDVSGNPLVADIAKMPHVLVAGTTGSGKSVLLNSWICSLLFRSTPQEVRLILVDPKRVELVGYNGIPHLLTPVITEKDKILSALRWATQEMEKRYKQFAEVGVKNIDGFNEMSGFQALPNIVILIDELAEVMSYSPVEVEDTICRLAQMARATGIHLVLATQRPSVDVITGLIKANVPTRLAFNVSSMTDSRVVLDTPGAERLLGRGDMLYVPPEQSKPMRIQGAFVSEKEVGKIVQFFKDKQVDVQYAEEVTSQPVSAMKKGGEGGSKSTDGKDELFDQALRLVCQHDKASASLLQRRLSVGYARAARIIDQLEESGIIGPGDGAKPRDVVIKNPDDYYALEARLAQESSSNDVL